MIIRIIEKTEYPKARKLCEACSYNGGLQDDDLVVMAEDDEFIGAVKICTEHGEKVLRGMQIDCARRRKGTGTLVLKFLRENIDRKDCYCIPYKHLKAFYGQIGFEEISPAGASCFLAERLTKYSANGLDVMVMKEKT
ncbi:GNAT family N-acetyltransferase [Mucilaginibacter gotjawali]|uniref:Uncharacterized protein n=2 Tax=Mucilaginibacter gotjawali TaxID=1550579 RepID=A0A0X8X1N4_9SPHI|nr:GNAT family N-acetyltransferase [Mucilaginibacter gotjawali]MBB3058069.1 putative N-acetyltransferase YhbS [Mucilaginibacter gotjawali]BAU52044.1 hypothetical protein MgSA37_00194 [Mucilaginibacter gotjawali]